ncbi:hypothetical protein AVME950_20725 [Acidovorax sp. SUPP950]|uniref:hypothetical protein n=1 Tax=Acidovorax sp. SUPP950 TaxID=511901 RepID=UPI0023C39062|nr:hypothetical protein [Acidovorax sp. SUPP950]GKS77363.1 hypothetical protein AVME950_20725 [Acidovorax sp. SUPP950]
MDKSIAQFRQFFEPIAGAGIVFGRHLDVHPEAKGDHVGGSVVAEDLALDAVDDDVAVKELADQRAERLGRGVLDAGVQDPCQLVRRAGELVVRHDGFQEALVLLQSQHAAAQQALNLALKVSAPCLRGSRFLRRCGVEH